jgi:hypothetical protein
VAHVVERNERLGDDQRHVRETDRVRVRLGERLNRADEVVAEEADRAAGERRQAVDRGDRVTVEVLADRRVGVGHPPRRGRGGIGFGLLGELTGGPAEHRARPKADERVAPEPPLLRRLEQERGAACLAELEEGGDRRLAVVDERGPDRDRVGARGELAGALERRLDPQQRGRCASRRDGH